MHFKYRRSIRRAERRTSEREFKSQGISVNEKRVGQLMREEGLRAKATRKFGVTTDSTHSRPVAPNTLVRDFTPSAPARKWVGDITCPQTEAGWLYFAVVIDLFSRKVMGWALDSRMAAELECRALSMALKTVVKLPIPCATLTAGASRQMIFSGALAPMRIHVQHDPKRTPLE